MKKTYKTLAEVKKEHYIVTGWRQPAHFEQSGQRCCYTSKGLEVFKAYDTDLACEVYVVQDKR